jgi:hypothetical protein
MSTTDLETFFIHSHKHLGNIASIYIVSTIGCVSRVQHVETTPMSAWIYHSLYQINEVLFPQARILPD